MLEKFTFEKKLGIDSSEKKYIGLKIATVSFLVAFTGMLIVSLGSREPGYWVVVVGISGGFVGMFFHFLAMFTKAFKD